MKEEFQLYSDLALKEHEPIECLKMLKYLIGPEGREVYKTLTFEQEETERTVNEVIEAFDVYCRPKKNETVERFKFNMRTQGDETLEKYVTDLKTLAMTCKFGDLCDSLIRDRIVCGVRDTSLRERLLRTDGLTCDKAIEIARAVEVTKQSVSALDKASPVTTVHKVQKSYRKRPQVPAKHSKPVKECIYCGRVHELKKELCPAYGKTCLKCKNTNHFSVKSDSLKLKHNRNFRNTTPHKRGVGKQTVNCVADNEHDTDDYYELLSVQEETCNSVKTNGEIFAALDIGDKRANFQVDSGATCNIIPKKLVPSHVPVTPTKSILKMFNKTTVTPLGKCQLDVHNPKTQTTHTADFIVLNDSCVPLIGNSLMQDMNLVSIHHQNILCISRDTKPLTMSDIVTDYEDVFTGTGKLEGKYHLVLDPDIKPVVHPPRKVPIAIKERLQSELDKLVEMNIITPVTEPTEWVSSMVTVVKPEKLRICLDPSDLNRAIKRSHYPLPTVEDILPNLSKAKCFSVLDAKNGFWQVELDRESSLLTTFNTPFGRYRWLRMPFGISSAPEEYQRRQDQTVEGLPGVHSVVDDILVYGEGDTEEQAAIDHDKKLIALLNRCREKGLKLNKDKLRLRQKEVRFVGHLITASGLKPDPDKVKAVAEMPEPTNVAGVRRFIGFVTYLSKFLIGLSDICEPLRKLTRQDVDWCWLETHSNAVREVKRLVTSQPVLRYFDPKEEVTLQVDASEKGLGAALLQKGQPVAFASRALTDVETRYAQIEKELLAVVYGLEKFHHYVYGRQVTVQSDHKPLEMITRKPLLAAPKRLQRMLLRLQTYSYSIVYQAGRLMYLADTLSRAYIQESTDQTRAHDDRYETINLTQSTQIADARLRDIQRETEGDDTLKALEQVIMHGWPARYSSTPTQLRPYFHIRDELVIQNGIIFKGERAVNPSSLRSEIKMRIHSSHIGIEGCLRRARETVYWPNMNSELKEYIGNCTTCSTYQNRQQKETLIPHEIPDRPWAKVGCDLFTIHEKDYLVTVDYYSNFFEVDHLPDTRSLTVVNVLRTQFARYGIPTTVISDNGPQFSSTEFKRFASEWQFEHITSSPAYPQSNGKAEQAVKTAKRLMRLAKESRSDPYLALLDFRNTPTQSMDSSPSQRLMGRRTQTLLPTKATLLQPKIQKSVSQKLLNSKETQASYYNRGAKDLQPLKPGDLVRIAPIQGQKTWKQGTVKEEVSTRSYNIKTHSGQVLRRNRRHLRKSMEREPEPEIVHSGGHDYPTPQIKDQQPVRNEIPEPSISASPRTTPKENQPEVTLSQNAPIVTRSGRSVIKPVKLDM